MPTHTHMDDDVREFVEERRETAREIAAMISVELSHANVEQTAWLTDELTSWREEEDLADTVLTHDDRGAVRLSDWRWAAQGAVAEAHSWEADALPRQHEDMTAAAQRERAQRRRNPPYRSWVAMMQRCHANYSGRGISVCVRWRSFANFLEDMWERPEDGTLERGGDLEPGAPA